MAKKKYNIGKDAEPLEGSYTAAGDAKWNSHLGKNLGVSYEVKTHVCLHVCVCVGVYAESL